MSEEDTTGLNIEIQLVQTCADLVPGGTESKDDDGTEAKDEKPKNSKLQFDYSEGITLLLGIIAIAVDPLFFYIPVMMDRSTCLTLDKKLRIVAVVLRTTVDILHDLSWWSKSRRGRSRSSRNEGASEKSMPNINRLLNSLNSRSKNYKALSPSKKKMKNNKTSPPSRRSSAISHVRKLLTRFKNSRILSPDGRSSIEARVMAIMASLPLPQVVVWAVDLQSHLKSWIKVWVVFQLVPRILRCYPTYTAAVTDLFLTYEWIGAAINLLLLALASHVLGGFWYIRSVDRKMDCLKEACYWNLSGCSEPLLYCENGYYLYSGNLSVICDPTSKGIDYGMYSAAITNDLVGSTDLMAKVSQSFWWGINSLSSSGLNIEVGNYIWDAFFAIFICFFGLILYALLIGNSQLYLQSTTPSTLAKLKEKRERLHEWPLFYSIPKQLRIEVCMCQHPKWQEVSEVNLESLLSNIPWQLRRMIKPYFCERLFHKVKEFEELDGEMRKELRERASAVVFQPETKIYKEGFPIYKMIHILDGKVLAFNRGNEELPVEKLKKDDSFGKELLQKALESPLSNYPLAKQTIQSVTKVEAFSISFDDFVKVFTKYGRSIEPYRKEWAAYVFRCAIRRCIAIRRLKEEYDERKEL